MYELDELTVEGTPRCMGQQQGESLRERVQSLVEHRMAELNGYFEERGEGSIDQIDGVGADCLQQLQAWDPPGYEEHMGVAESAGVDAARLLAVLNMTDTRDLVCWGTGSDDEGCTAMSIPTGCTRESIVVMAQSWDLNRGDLKHVVAVHRLPDDGPETWAVTVAGGPTLIGMNEHGLWVGTTNLKTRDVQSGIGYMNLLHRAIREATVASAAKTIETARRIAAHTYWLGDAAGALLLECTATTAVGIELETAPLFQTNHCLDEDHRSREAEVPSQSSQHRYERARTLLVGDDFDLDSVRSVLSDRSEGALSISRHPEDNQESATNACAIGIPAQRIFEACRGPADQGRWVRLGFQRG